MISKAQAIAAKYRKNFYFISKGAVKQVRVSGKCKTWKSVSRCGEFQLPIKFGLYEHGYMTQDNAHIWYATQAEADAALADLRTHAVKR